MFLGSHDRAIRIWDSNTGECIGILQGHTNKVSSLAATDGKVFSGSWDNTIRIWDSNTGECLAMLQGDMGKISSLAVANGRVFLGVDSLIDDNIRIWDFDYK